jgi:protein-tyrosine phosphatase
MDYMEECLEFIERHRPMTNVFVHCYAGMSRSATVVIAYLMKSHMWPYDSALAFLRWKRAIVNPN